MLRKSEMSLVYASALPRWAVGLIVTATLITVAFCSSCGWFRALCDRSFDNKIAEKYDDQVEELYSLYSHNMIPFSLWLFLRSIYFPHCLVFTLRIMAELLRSQIFLIGYCVSNAWSS